MDTEQATEAPQRERYALFVSDLREEVAALGPNAAVELFAGDVVTLCDALDELSGRIYDLASRVYDLEPE